MTQITVADLNNAKIDVDNIGAIMNSTAETVTDRLGRVRRTIHSLSNEFPGAVAASVTAIAAANSAEIDAAAALADRILAETARDAANVIGKIYESTALGLAATTTGQYFSVPSTVTEELLILYLNSAGSAVEQKRYYVGVSTPKILQKTETWLSMLHGITWSDGWLSAGVPNGNPSYKSTDFIPVVAGDVYCTNIVFSVFTFYYDSAKEVVKRCSSNIGYVIYSAERYRHCIYSSLYY